MNIFCRINGSRRRDESEESCLRTDGKNISIETEGGTKVFNSYDGVFDVTADQEEVYAGVNEVVDFSSVVGGKSLTVLAYGQTGGGKTHTIYGEIWKQNSLRGLLPRAAEAVFNEVQTLEVEEPDDIEVCVSFISIYNEEISDLLDDSRRKGALLIKESQARGVYIQDLHEEPVVSLEDTIEQLRRGMQNVMVACTSMEISHSRLHTIFTLSVYCRVGADAEIAAPDLSMQPVSAECDKPAAAAEQETDRLPPIFAPTSTPTVPPQAPQELPPQPQMQLIGKLVFADLAGSERQAKTGATGASLREASNISKSLAALSNVISSLCDGKRHVPYRDSKLTRLLQGALGGGGKTAFIGAVTCWTRDSAETLCVLRFLQRVRMCHRPASVGSGDAVADARDGSAEQAPAVTAVERVLQSEDEAAEEISSLL